MALTDSEFSAAFLKEATPLGKIKLAIREERYNIWIRKNKPNVSEEYLLPVLELPDGHDVRVKRRSSGGQGSDCVYVMQYSALIMGKKIVVYLKAYFEKDDGSVIGLEVQSLRNTQLTLVEDN